MKMASRVLFTAIDRVDDKKLPYTPVGFYRDVNESGVTVGYNFNAINFKIAEFCSWALDLQYDLPEILVRLSKNSSINGTATIQMAEGTDVEETPNNQGKIPKGGNRKGALAEALEEAYLKFWKEGNTEILRKGKIRDFLERLKELSDEKGNRNFSKYIADRIDSIKITPSNCTITTKDQYIKSTNQREYKEISRNYKQGDVSKHLTSLRKKYPLPS
ncbi:hypothetical protein [Geobacter argillaceus]|uniref:Uncharacterized protein n=1 Tax=Geobacter argillaceus TaxID=345631 RepID=A0A562V6X4_9BACT|nr:hypothetical protein [Geobacter argillaceus]TWJ13665.1 hypothetical protein JN12_03717 [Geobacter argillaceus]